MRSLALLLALTGSISSHRGRITAPLSNSNDDHMASDLDTGYWILDGYWMEPSTLRGRRRQACHTYIYYSSIIKYVKYVK